MNIESESKLTGSNIPPAIVEMKAVTWPRDSHGLFDYECRSMDVKKFALDASSVVVRDKGEIAIKPSNFDKSQMLVSVTSAGTDQYFINPVEHQSISDDEGNLSAINGSPNGGNLTDTGAPSPNKVFLIVRSFKNAKGVQKGYPLTPGLVIKFGRVCYRVLGVGHPDGERTTVENITKYSAAQPTAGEAQTCRICLEEADPASGIQDEDKIMISPCKCKGSCQYLHLSCFRNWFGSKIAWKKIGNTHTCNWKTCECEVCQEPIPRNFTVEGKPFSFFDWSSPPTPQGVEGGVAGPNKDPYLVLECLSRQKKTAKIIHVCRFTAENNVVNLGRGHQCDVRISDISVSRLHAMIKYENGQFLLVDNNSKFGTLIMLHEPFPIAEEKIAVQVGRTVITFVKRLRGPIHHDNHHRHATQLTSLDTNEQILANEPQRVIRQSSEPMREANMIAEGANYPQKDIIPEDLDGNRDRMLIENDNMQEYSPLDNKTLVNRPPVFQINRNDQKVAVDSPPQNHLPAGLGMGVPLLFTQQPRLNQQAQGQPWQGFDGLAQQFLTFTNNNNTVFPHLDPSNFRINFTQNQGGRPAQNNNQRRSGEQ